MLEITSPGSLKLHVITGPGDTLGTSEFSPIEIIQPGILAICGLLYAWVAKYCPSQRPIAFLFGALLAMGRKDGNIQLRDLATGSITRTIAGHEEWIYALAFSPDGELIAFRSEREGGGIFLMGATGESVRRLTDFGYEPAWSPDGKEIVYATEGVWSPGSRFGGARCPGTPRIPCRSGPCSSAPRCRGTVPVRVYRD